MKKQIWILLILMLIVSIGASMLISGVIGLVGWFIACALTVQPGARSRVWGCLNGLEWAPENARSCSV